MLSYSVFPRYTVSVWLPDICGIRAGSEWSKPRSSVTLKERNTKAANGNSVSITQPAIPIFKWKCYEFLSIKMKTLFNSQYHWDLVENGYADPDEENWSFFSWDCFFKNPSNYDFKASLGILQNQVSGLIKGNYGETPKSSQWVWNLAYEREMSQSKIFYLEWL